MKYLILLLFVAGCYAALRGGAQSAKQAYVRVPPSHKRDIQEGDITLTIGLKQRNVDKLENIFWSVSNPNSPAYGQHLTLAEMIDLVAPAQESVSAVVEWLSSKGVQNVQLSGANDFIKIDVPVSQVESIFETPITTYAHKKSGVPVASMDDGYVLPDHISDLVDFVSHFNPIRNAPEYFPDEIKDNHESLRRTRDTLASSNAPVILALYTTNGGFLLNRFVVYCLDGSIPIVGADTVTCGDGTGLVGIEGNITNNITGSLMGSNIIPTQCVVCSSDGLCKQLTNVAQNAVVCTTEEVTGIPNYLPWQISFSALWGVSNTSFTKTSAAISNVLESAEDATPDVITRVYNIKSSQTVTQTNNSQAVIQFSESFLLSDATKYFQAFGLPDMTNLIEVVNTQWANNTNPGFGEGILDIDCIMGTARNCKTYFWGNKNVEDAFLTWITDVLNAANPPLVHSVSWGGPEADPFVSGPDFNVRTNIEFMKAGARGLSIIVASGDSGPQFYANSSFPAYLPSFPASSPYVTAVGATVFVAASHDPSCYNGTEYKCAVGEQACSTQNGAVITSGGGFSDVFLRPSYQDSALSGYVQTISAAQIAAGVNVSGRGFPDVATIGHNIPLFYNGQPSRFDGTSASAPFFAGMVTLLNDIRLAQGNGPLGFLNPFLYQLDPSNFNDVTVGNSFCVATGCTANGFAASSGWDPVTGLGTPNFDKIAAAVRALPATNNTSPTSPPTSSPPEPSSSPSPSPSPSSSPSPSPSSTPTPSPATTQSSTTQEPTQTSSAAMISTGAALVVGLFIVTLM